MSKIIWYDTTVHDPEWLASCTFAGDNLGWSVTSKQYMEDLRVGDGSFSGYVGFEDWNTANPGYVLDTSERLYDADGNWGLFSASIEDDNSSIINQLGHSSWNTPFSLPNWLYRYNTCLLYTSPSPRDQLQHLV